MSVNREIFWQSKVKPSEHFSSAFPLPWARPPPQLSPPAAPHPCAAPAPSRPAAGPPACSSPAPRSPAGDKGEAGVQDSRGDPTTLPSRSRSPRRPRSRCPHGSVPHAAPGPSPVTVPLSMPRPISLPSLPRFPCYPWSRWHSPCRPQSRSPFSRSLSPQGPAPRVPPPVPGSSRSPRPRSLSPSCRPLP